MSVKGTPRSQLGNRLRHSHTLEISAKMDYFGVTRQALLMSPKRRNTSRDGLVKLVEAVSLLKFACYFVTYYVLGLYLLSLALILDTVFY